MLMQSNEHDFYCPAFAHIVCCQCHSIGLQRIAKQGFNAEKEKTPVENTPPQKPSRHGHCLCRSPGVNTVMYIRHLVMLDTLFGWGWIMHRPKWFIPLISRNTKRRGSPALRQTTNDKALLLRKRRRIKYWSLLSEARLCEAMWGYVRRWETSGVSFTSKAVHSSNKISRWRSPSIIHLTTVSSEKKHLATLNTVWYHQKTYIQYQYITYSTQNMALIQTRKHPADRVPVVIYRSNWEEPILI